MKRFTIFIAVLLTVSVGVALAAMPKDNEVVKIEVVGAMDRVVYTEAVKPELAFDYVAEPAGEVIIESIAPDVIGKIHDAYTTPIFDPPVSRDNKGIRYSKRH